jgi:hypothetical protein
MGDDQPDSAEDRDWHEYQQNEIDEAYDDINDRLNHLSGRVQDGMLDGELLNEHQNKRLQAYMEGYADALQYAQRRVERIENLAQYAQEDTPSDD